MTSRRIPEELVVEILKWLPVKSLLRFKATSKRWYALISCPNFIKSHLASAPDRFLILDDFCGDTQFFLFPDDDDKSRAVKLNTHGHESVIIDFNQICSPAARFSLCDGIVCLFGGFIYDVSVIPPITPIILWNPATRKFKSLPTSSYSTSNDKIRARMYWDVSFGFGFDSKTDDYKVVAITSLWLEGEGKHFMTYAEVYSLKTNSWRVIDGPNAPFLDSGRSSTSTQGECYWVVYHDHIINIVSFDMKEEVFRVTPAPPPKLPSEFGPYTELASSNESLVVMYYNTCSPIEVWAMKDLLTTGGDCWTLEYILEPPAAVPADFHLCYPLGLWKNCLLFTQSGYDREFFLYNPGTGEIRNLQFPASIYPLSTSRYKETLVSLA